MSTADTVALACQHQDQIVQILAWMGGVMPVASCIAWLTARYNKLPPLVQALLQVAAGNFLHAAKGEPTTPASNNGASP